MVEACNDAGSDKWKMMCKRKRQVLNCKEGRKDRERVRGEGEG